jgi:hypothetical protein
MTTFKQGKLGRELLRVRGLRLFGQQVVTLDYGNLDFAVSL